MTIQLKEILDDPLHLISHSSYCITLFFKRVLFIISESSLRSEEGQYGFDKSYNYDAAL